MFGRRRAAVTWTRSGCGHVGLCLCLRCWTNRKQLPTTRFVSLKAARLAGWRGEQAGVNARSIQAAGAHIFAQCCMSNRLLTLRRICFPSAGRAPWSKYEVLWRLKEVVPWKCPEPRRRISLQAQKPNRVFLGAQGADRWQTSTPLPRPDEAHAFITNATTMRANNNNGLPLFKRVMPAFLGNLQ